MPHGLDQGSSNVCLMVVACTVVGAVAVGTRVLVGAIYSARKSFFRFLDHVALQRINNMRDEGRSTKCCGTV